MSVIEVHTGSASYAVHIGSGLLATLGERLGRLAAGKIMVVTSPGIWAGWSRRFTASLPGKLSEQSVLFVPPGEESKCLATVEKLAEQMVKARADRDTVLVAFGGGVIGDLTGFLAAIYMRGMGYVQVPTTLLAQVDSSVGGKTGVNLRSGKNLIGSFHHPLAVFADPELFSTLPARELRAGLYESLKAGIIRDPELFAFMEQNTAVILDREPEAITRVVTASVRVKADVVAADERESAAPFEVGGGAGERVSRMILNFGHTVGHAIEAADQYRSILHGEAVGWGMIAATKLALGRSEVQREIAERIQRAILSYGPLPQVPFTPANLLALTASDKKNRAGHRRFVLPVDIGKTRIATDVTDDQLAGAISGMLALAQQHA